MEGQHRNHGGDRKGDALPRKNRFRQGAGERQVLFHYRVEFSFLRCIVLFALLQESGVSVKVQNSVFGQVRGGGH